MYSEILRACEKNQNVQRIVYWNRNGDITYGFPVLYNKSCIPMNFDPWSGVWISENYKHYIDHKSCNTIKELKDDHLLLEKFQINRKLHCNGRYCTELESHTRFGERGDSSIIEIPNSRVVGVLNKTKYGGWKNDKIELFFRRNGYQGLEKWEFSGWTPMDYCPFCGAKLPERLDGKLTEILQKEYGLASWKDYKKAPKEFHSDEWWRKRGL